MSANDIDIYMKSDDRWSCSCTPCDRCTDEIARLTAEVATLRQRCGRLRGLALASVRPQGLVTSPESVRWFNARRKCYTNNDFKETTDE